MRHTYPFLNLGMANFLIYQWKEIVTLLPKNNPQNIQPPTRKCRYVIQGLQLALRTNRSLELGEK